jgi:hypothetical protein
MDEEEASDPAVGEALLVERKCRHVPGPTSAWQSRLAKALSQIASCTRYVLAD